MGNEVGLMYERRFNMTRKEEFPSPMGIEVGLIKDTIRIGVYTGRHVSVPYGD